jgi:hypothetical protein
VVLEPLVDIAAGCIPEFLFLFAGRDVALDGLSHMLGLILELTYISHGKRKIMRKRWYFAPAELRNMVRDEMGKQRPTTLLYADIRKPFGEAQQGHRYFLFLIGKIKEPVANMVPINLAALQTQA